MRCANDDTIALRIVRPPSFGCVFWSLVFDRRDCGSDQQEGLDMMVNQNVWLS
jgi:hypothetical protein